MSLRNAAVGMAVLAGLFLLSILLGTLIAVGEEATSDALGIVRLDGVISYAEPGGLFGGGRDVDDVIAQLEDARDSSSVRGVLLVVNSPGGSPVATMELVGAIERLRAEKPVVAWIAETGASGAYWAATACNRTIASPLAVTGSIGVFSEHVSLAGLYGKLGINTTVIKGGRLKDMGSSHRGLTEEELTIQEGVVNQTYEVFMEAVAANRNLTMDEVRAVATGRLYTGLQAKELGLVDEVGGKEGALRAAAELAGLAWPVRTVELEPKRGLLDLMEELTATLGYGVGRGLSSGLEQRVEAQGTRLE